MSSKKSKIIIIFGRSGSGKGTQAKLLLKEFGFNYVASGDLLRARIKKNDFSGKKLKKVLDKGDRAPSFLVFRIWSQIIANMREKINKNGLVIDGSPRTLSEAEFIDELLEWYQWSDVRVILLDISEQEAFDRLTKRRICKKCGRLIPWVGDFRTLKVCDKCGGQLIIRHDDKPGVIKERMAYYRKDVVPAVEYYKKHGRLIKIDGEKSIEDVYYDIKKAIS